MKPIIHKANTRGHAKHGWLESFHTFSFANYHNPDRMHFGALRVLNDDFIDAGEGFGTHPHRDMEIVTIPLSGALQHADSTGRREIIRHGEVQIMSAGTGIAHSEMNASKNEPVTLLQIWVMPKKLGIDPRYDQRVFNTEDRKNKFQTVVSPNGEGLYINQDAFFSLANLDSGKTLKYSLKGKDSAVYFFVINGAMDISGHTLDKRDAIGLADAEISLEALKDTELLAIEVPLA